MERERSYTETLTISDQELEQYVRDLAVDYAHLRLHETQLWALQQCWQARDLNLIVGKIADAYRLPRRFIRIAFSAIKPNSNALAKLWMESQGNNHVYRILFQQSERQILAGKMGLLFHAVAHELAHGRLFTDRHPLRHSEVAVDVLVLLLGFDRTYADTQSPGQLTGYIRTNQQPLLVELIQRYGDVVYCR